jgi:hypothetical protein
MEVKAEQTKTPAISKEDRERWIKLFNEADLKKDGFLRGTSTNNTSTQQPSLPLSLGDLAMKIFARSQLSPPQLHQIWYCNIYSTILMIHSLFIHVF